jgi:S1-C subfamily serine protease
MPTWKSGLLPALMLLALISPTNAQPGFPQNGALGQPPVGFGGRPMGISGISGRPPTGFSGMNGASGFPPSGISGIRGGGPTGISGGFSGGVPGPRFESVWTCTGCRKEVARGNLSHPPANCPHCGVKLINGFGPSSSGTGPINPPPNFPANPNSGPSLSPPMDPEGPAPNPGNPGVNAPSFPATADTGTNVYLSGMRSTVQVIVPVGGDRAMMGSGSVVDLQQGYILTNWHVVNGSSGNVTVLFPMWANGRPVVEPDRYRNARQNALQGRVLASDRKCDLAVIKLLQPARIPTGTTAVAFSADSPLAGGKVYSIGNPAASDSMWVYTPGDVRNVYSKRWTAGIDGAPTSEHSAKIIEATSPTSPGDSGGPCFNDRGEQIGVTQGGLSAKVAQGFSYFIDGSEVKAFLSRNGVAYNVASGGGAISQPPVTSSPTESPPPSFSESSTSPNSSSTGTSDSVTKSSGDSNSSRSSGSGSSRVIVVVLACLIGFAALGAIIFGATRGASAPRRKKRPIRDF